MPGEEIEWKISYMLQTPVVCINSQLGIVWIAQFKLVYGCPLRANTHARAHTEAQHMKVLRAFDFGACKPSKVV